MFLCVYTVLSHIQPLWDFAEVFLLIIPNKKIWIPAFFFRGSLERSLQLFPTFMNHYSCLMWPQPMTLMSYIVCKAAVAWYSSMQCAMHVLAGLVSIRGLGLAAVYFYCLVLSGPLPETTADSMKPYVLSHTLKKGGSFRDMCVWCL